MKKQLLGIFIGLLGTMNLLAQASSLKDMEDDLVGIYSKLFSFYQQEHDSLEKQSDLFSAKMVDYISKNPSTLNYPFKTLVDSNACDVVTSDDGLLRIYSWDTWMGGTMHIFANIFQYKAGGRVYTRPMLREEYDAGTFYSDIFTFKANGKTYYLAISNAILSTKDAWQSIRVYTIEKSSLNDSIRLFKTKKEFLNSIDVDFNFFSVVDRPERPVRLIKYDSARKIVYIPVVQENGKVTDQFILYQYKGKYFEHILTQKKPHVAPDVQVIDDIFEEYKGNEESIDSKEHKEAMTKAFQSLQNRNLDNKTLLLLVDVWMYYDPTDFPTRKLIDPIFQKNKTAVLKAIDYRINNKRSWESEENSELPALRDKLSGKNP